MISGVPKPDAISIRVFLRQYSWGKCKSRTQICAWVWACACGVKSQDQQKNLIKPGLKLTAPIAHTLCTSSTVLKWNSKNPFPSGVKSQFRMFGHNLLNFIFSAKVVRGESPLRSVSLPWMLLQQSTRPASYSAWVILTWTDFPITTFGGSWEIWW